MYKYNVTIKEIIDGDTVKVDIDLGFDLWLRDQPVRLVGIDTPETRTTNLTEKKFGILAKTFVEQSLPIGSKQTMVSTEIQRGKFGRILGEFLIDDPDTLTPSISLNNLLVDKRLAIVYNGKRSKWSMRTEHKANRKYLIENGIVDK